MQPCTAATLTHDHITAQKAALLLMAAVTAYVWLVSPAFASGGALSTVLCSVVTLVSGNLGRGLATLAVIIVGVGATLGKVTWGMAITVAVGIAIIFNAGAIVTALQVNSGGACP